MFRGLIYFTHAAGADGRQDLVGIQALAGLQRSGSINELRRCCRGPGLEAGGFMVIGEQQPDFTL